MDGSRRVKDVFLEVVEVPAHERPQLLDRLCGSDLRLRAEVEALLAEHAGAGSFLETRGPAWQAPGTPSEGIGATIGVYTLLDLIGEGGFGSVFRAQQLEPVAREVAFKIIKLGMDTREVIARFDAERRALALMEHPNIATVLDAGATATGRPYFVMEFVRGEPITSYCDRHQVGTADRLELFMQVCAAVQHAHT